MANRLVRLTPVSITTSTPDAGAAFNQINVQPILGLTDGAGVCIDRAENLYVTDFTQHVIYKLQRGSSTSRIFVGAYGVSGLADGQGSDARFNAPAGIAVDNAGFLYVVDSGNARIRKVTPNGNVYTVAAIPPAFGEVGDITVDASGNIYYIDSTV